MTTALSDDGVMFADGSTLSATLRGHLFGCTLSTAGASATMSISAGQWTNSTNTVTASLAARDKTTAAWAVGTAAGGLDSGAIAINSWYHFYAIRRPDTGVVDVLFSLSATAPTLPASYTQFRRIGSSRTDGSGLWMAFSQIGDDFLWSVPVSDLSATNPGIAAVLATLTVPIGVKVRAQLGSYLRSSASAVAQLLTAPEQADTAPALAGPFTNVTTGGPAEAAAYAQVYTDTSARIRYRLSVSTADVIVRFTTLGWTDTRGRNA